MRGSALPAFAAGCAADAAPRRPADKRDPDPRGLYDAANRGNAAPDGGSGTQEKQHFDGSLAKTPPELLADLSAALISALQRGNGASRPARASGRPGVREQHDFRRSGRVRQRRLRSSAR